VDDAETLLARCEEDLAAAEGDLRERNRLITEQHLHERAASLDPETRAEAARLMGAQGRWDAAVRACEAARSRLDHLLSQYPESIGEYERHGMEGGRHGDVFRSPSSQPVRRTDIFRPRQPFTSPGDADE
jgi:hypothetical protein